MPPKIPLFTLPSSSQKLQGIAYGSGTNWYKNDSSAPINRTLVDAAKQALSVGYRHLDTAEVYNTESEIGLAIKESGVPRNELFVVTKVIRDIRDPITALENSLRKLQLEYVDLYLIHAPFFNTATHGIELPAAWAHLEKLVDCGLTRAIGVSNFSIPQLTSLLSIARIKPVYNQIEFNPYCNDSELIKFCQDNGILVAAYSPLASLNKFPGGSVDACVKRIAGVKGKSEAQVLLKWVLQQGVVAVTTSGKVERLREYTEMEGWELTKEEMEEITREGGREKRRIYWTEHYKE